VVIGDAMLDKYIKGISLRLSPEAPVPVLNSPTIETRLGGAANVAFNLRKLGASCSLFTLVGNDNDAETLKVNLHAEGIDYAPSVDPSRETTVKLRVISNGQQLVRVDYETKAPFQHNEVWYEKIASKISEASVVILSDYNKGCLSNCAKIIDFCLARNVPVIVDPKGCDFSKYLRATLLTPNEAEILEIIGPWNNETDLREKVFRLIEDLELKGLLLTRSSKGMTLFYDGISSNFSVRARDVIDVTGAGDTVVATVAAFLSRGFNLKDAVYHANVAAGLVVAKNGTSTVTYDEIRGELFDRFTSKIMDHDSFESIYNHWKKIGETIVFTNGCFDILHVGHVDYLVKSKKLGTKLVVAVNNDKSVKKLKGDSRPINGEEERMHLLSSLQCVDAVVMFSEETPEQLYNRFVPDILVKGGDYDVSNIAGATRTIQNGGQVKIIPIEHQISTSAIIEKLQLSD